MMGDPVAVGPLCTAMHNPDPLLRMIIVEALGKIGDPAAVDTLRLALGDVDQSVAGAARKSLKKMGALPGQK
jgi:HEAT repeat protein